MQSPRRVNSRLKSREWRARDGDAVTAGGRTPKCRWSDKRPKNSAAAKVRVMTARSGHQLFELANIDWPVRPCSLPWQTNKMRRRFFPDNFMRWTTLASIAWVDARLLRAWSDFHNPLRSPPKAQQ
jgi:hypothetical protein